MGRAYSWRYGILLDRKTTRDYGLWHIRKHTSFLSASQSILRTPWITSSTKWVRHKGYGWHMLICFTVGRRSKREMSRRPNHTRRLEERSTRRPSGNRGNPEEVTTLRRKSRSSRYRTRNWGAKIPRMFLSNG